VKKLERGDELAKRGKKFRKTGEKSKADSSPLMDVDGNIDRCRVTLLSQSDGSALELKNFDAHDGQGLTLAVTAGCALA